MANWTEEYFEKRFDQVSERFRGISVRKQFKEALKEFQTLRRMQCAVERGYDSSIGEVGIGDNCISCGSFRIWNNCDAGHYRKSKDFPAVAFSELNVHIQCKFCNDHLGGNEAEYRKGLIRKIGLKDVILLESWAQVNVQFARWDFARLRECYRAKQEVEKARLGI